ncbi:MAG: glycosyltransferase family 87 protein [Candidatus Binatales bacterium]
MQSPAIDLANRSLLQTPPDAAAGNRRRQRRILAIIWVAVLGAFVTMLAGLRARQNQLDFSHYYTSAMALRAGQDPYTTDLTPYAAKAGLDIAHINHADYPPTFVLCSELLTFFPAPIAYWIWIGVSLIALGVTLRLLLSGLARDDAVMAWMLAALALMYPPIREHFQTAQCQVLILLMIVLAARWMDEGNERAAGMVLAFAALLRAFPVLLAGYLVVRRRWRTLGYMALGLAIGIGATIGLIGAHTSLGFVGRFKYLTEDNWIYRPANVALISFLSRLFLYCFKFPFSAQIDLARRLVVSASRLALLALTAWATRSHAGDRGQDRRALSLWIVAMILLSPTAWFHYFVLLLMPLIEVISAARYGRASRRAAATAAASYVLTLAATILGSMLEGGLGSLAEGVLKETKFVSLAIAYLAAYWFVRDGLRLSADELAREPYVPSRAALDSAIAS